ncbi:MAG TPA: class I SAM-dependent methyltransferase [Dongiaceae bacterium]|nr:class I SAM-dependent methyltransferase [Dongiaceae bacterium]
MTTAPAVPHTPFSRPRHQGTGYLKLLRRLHALQRPRHYLEIGTAAGKTLALARCASIAIDPRFRLAQDVRAGKPACHLFEMTSDAFFAAHNPTALFGGPIDLAFIDGMHHFDFALRDFMNIEPHCRPDSLIVLHDCLPVDDHMARRDPRDRSRTAQSHYPNAWAGDTWKALWILQRYRPDLRIFAFDAPPSGLVVVTRLDPSSTLIKQRYDEALAAAHAIDLAGFYAGFEILPTAALRRRSWLSSLIRPRRFDFSAHLAAS